MNQLFTRRLAVVGTFAAASTFLGCASVAVTDTALQQRTAVSLSLAPGSFTISNRQNSGVRSDYDVTTQDGRQFACYVTGAVSVTGRNVSDALCHATPKLAAGSTPAPAVSPKPATTCNALLQAAGRC
jgi:hypothetical protein